MYISEYNKNEYNKCKHMIFEFWSNWQSNLWGDDSHFKNSAGIPDTHVKETWIIPLHCSICTLIHNVS